MTLRNSFRRFALVAGSVAGSLSGQSYVNALEITLRFNEGFSVHAGAREAIEKAARRWEQALIDPVDVAFDIFLDDLDFLTAAESAVVEGELPYSELRDALVGDATSPIDTRAVNHLPLGPYLSFRTLAADRSPTINSGTDFINEMSVVSSANAKALGFDVGDLESDGEIWFNESLFDFDFYDVDPTDGVDGYDLVGVATHEMGHLLGFNSGVDLIDFVFYPNPIPPEIAGELPTVEELNGNSVLTSLDLFRRSSAAGELIDMTPGADAYFSVDAGATNLAAFATGALNGDGVQAGHWKHDVGNMTGEISFDTAFELSGIDLMAMDAIGWDLRPVPEPSVIFMTLLLTAPLAISHKRAGATKH